MNPPGGLRHLGGPPPFFNNSVWFLVGLLFLALTDCAKITVLPAFGPPTPYGCFLSTNLLLWQIARINKKNPVASHLVRLPPVPREVVTCSRGYSVKLVSSLTLSLGVAELSCKRLQCRALFRLNHSLPSRLGLTTLGAFKSYSWVPSRPTKKAGRRHKRYWREVVTCSRGYSVEYRFV